MTPSVALHRVHLIGKWPPLKMILSFAIAKICAIALERSGNEVFAPVTAEGGIARRYVGAVQQNSAVQTAHRGVIWTSPFSETKTRKWRR